MIPKEQYFETISIFILSSHGIVQCLMKAKTFKDKVEEKKPTSPPPISLSPAAFAFFLEEKTLFSSSILMKTAKLVENILFAQCLCKIYDRKQRFFFLSHEGKSTVFIVVPLILGALCVSGASDSP